MNLHRLADPAAAAQACADRVLELLTATLHERSEATLAISGGSSPKPMFGIFARFDFAWERVHLFFVDERVVPPTDPQSNFKLANDMWLSPSAFPSPNVHRIQTELGAEEAARDYQAQIRRHFKLQDGQMPRFDVIHRGMGPDSHTASLFPGEPLIGDNTPMLVERVWVEKMQQWRVTMLPGVLKAAAHTVMLVTGPDKAPALHATLRGVYDPMQHPAQLARETAEWFVDKAAAAELV